MSYQKSVNAWYFVNNGNVYTFSDASVITDKWYCVCLTRSNSGTIKLYVNGVQSTSTFNDANPLTMTNLLFGQETDCYGGCFATNQTTNGKFDDIKIYYNELTLSNINSICSSSSSTSTCSDIASYNFTSGSGADVSGNGNNGTLFGSTANVDTLLIGYNITDYFQIPANVLNGRLEFSLCFKVKFNGLNISGASPTNHLISGDLSSAFGSFAMSYQKSVNAWYFVNNGNVYTFSDTSVITDKWYCVCLTRGNSGAIKLYVNGVQSTSTFNDSNPLTMTNLLFGQETDCYGGCFATNQTTNGKFDFIRICSGEISSNEINNICSFNSVGINDTNKPSSTLFPNPVINNLSINNPEGISKIELISIDGKILFKQHYHQIFSIIISMDDLSSGIYFIKLSTPKSENIYKIIKN